MGQKYLQADETVVTDHGETRVPDADVYDRGLRGHRSTQNALARWVKGQGLEPLSPALGDPPFDLGWWDDQVFVVAEVKSLMPWNETGQIRLGLGQILEYVHRIGRHHDQVMGVLAVESKPTDPIWKDLCATNGIQLTWPPFGSP